VTGYKSATRILFLEGSSRPEGVWGPASLFQCLPTDISPWIKESDRESKHSSPTGDSTPPIRLHGVSNFIFSSYP